MCGPAVSGCGGRTSRRSIPSWRTRCPTLTRCTGSIAATGGRCGLCRGCFSGQGSVIRKKTRGWWVSPVPGSMTAKQEAAVRDHLARAAVGWLRPAVASTAAKYVRLPKTAKWRPLVEPYKSWILLQRVPKIAKTHPHPNSIRKYTNLSLLNAFSDTLRRRDTQTQRARTFRRRNVAISISSRACSAFMRTSTRYLRVVFSSLMAGGTNPPGRRRI